MRVKSLLIIFLIGSFVGASGDVFETKLAKARYQDLSGSERIEAYGDVLRAIHRGFASDAQVGDFVQAVLGLLKQRTLGNVSILKGLLDLVKNILASKVSAFTEHKGVFAYWKDVLEADLQKFALNNGEIIKMRFFKERDNCFSVRMKNNIPVVENDRADGLSAYFKVALSGVSHPGEQPQIILGGDAIELVPLYCERSGICCAFDDEKALYCFSSQGAEDSILLAVCSPAQERMYSPLSVVKKEKNPLYVGEQVSLRSSGCNAWDGCVERVDTEKVKKLENENLEAALNRIKLMPGASEKIDWMIVLAPNLNTRIVEKNYKLFFKVLSTIFSARMTLDKDALVAARKLLFQLSVKTGFGEHKKYFSEWLYDLNQRLLAYSLKYSDCLKISSKQQQGSCFSIIPHLVSRADAIAKEFKVGLGARQSFAPGYDLCSLVSSVGKTGPIFYGDEVELSFPHLDEIGEVRCVVKVDGTQGRLQASSLEDLGEGDDTLFVVSSPFFGIDEVSGPLVVGDECMLKSKKTGLVIGFLRGDGADGWSNLVSCERSSHSKKSVVFTVSKVEAGGVETVVTQSFFSKLSQIKLEQSYVVKMEKLLRILDGMSLKISIDDRNDFWDIMMLLVADKKHMSEGEIKQLVDLLLKIVSVAKLNGFSSWIIRAEQAFIDVEFYKKVKRALSSPGMDRFKEMLQLVGDLKKVSKSESEYFLEELRLLRKYKKDQSKAAKLLLMHVSEEVGAANDKK
ncbi:hypothetical protein FJ366_00620 [Candidatus Dependentiae bacterium]|nr:hypothetical protein [Candidatus Dependentiae bacterium]